MRAALAFLTPVGGARVPTRRTLPWFAPVGALLGAATGGVWEVSTGWWTPAVGAALTIVASLTLTGMLHVDGLGDSADGLLPHLTPERRLSVMREPDIGAFGVAAIGAALLVQFASLSSTEPDWIVVAALWATTRGGAALVLATRPYARAGGLADAFRGPSPTAVATALAALAACASVDPSVAAAAALAFAAVIAFGERRLGGYTGDVLGAAIVVAETAGLLAAAA